MACPGVATGDPGDRAGGVGGGIDRGAGAASCQQTWADAEAATTVGADQSATEGEAEDGERGIELAIGTGRTLTTTVTTPKTIRPADAGLVLYCRSESA